MIKYTKKNKPSIERPGFDTSPGRKVIETLLKGVWAGILEMAGR